MVWGFIILILKNLAFPSGRKGVEMELRRRESQWKEKDIFMWTEDPEFTQQQFYS